MGVWETDGTTGDDGVELAVSVSGGDLREGRDREDQALRVARAATSATGEERRSAAQARARKDVTVDLASAR